MSWTSITAGVSLSWSCPVLPSVRVCINRLRSHRITLQKSTARRSASLSTTPHSWRKLTALPRIVPSMSWSSIRRRSMPKAAVFIWSWTSSVPVGPLTLLQRRTRSWLLMNRSRWRASRPKSGWKSSTRWSPCATRLPTVQTASTTWSTGWMQWKPIISVWLRKSWSKALRNPAVPLRMGLSIWKASIFPRQTPRQRSSSTAREKPACAK